MCNNYYFFTHEYHCIAHTPHTNLKRRRTNEIICVKTKYSFEIDVALNDVIVIIEVGVKYTAAVELLSESNKRYCNNKNNNR